MKYSFLLTLSAIVFLSCSDRPEEDDGLVNLDAWLDEHGAIGLISPSENLRIAITKIDGTFTLAVSDGNMAKSFFGGDISKGHRKASHRLELSDDGYRRIYDDDFDGIPDRVLYHIGRSVSFVDLSITIPDQDEALKIAQEQITQKQQQEEED